MKKRSHLFPLVVLAFLAVASIAAYGFHAAFNHHVMETSEVPHFDVEVVPGSNPVNLKITVQGLSQAQKIRSISMKRQGQAVDVLYHMSIAGIGQPGQDWQEPYVIAVPDTVNEVRFGRTKAVIWLRKKQDLQNSN